MKITEKNNTDKLIGVYEVRATTFTDGGNTFYYVWEVEFDDESIADFVEAVGIKQLSVTGVREIGAK